MYIMSMREVVEAYKNVVWYSDKEITAKNNFLPKKFDVCRILSRRIKGKMHFSLNLLLQNLEVSEIMPIFATRMRVAYRRDDIKLRNRSIYTKPLVEYLRL